PLITTNCAVLGVTMLVLEKAEADASYTFLHAMVNTLGTGIGYLIAMILFAGVRERLEDADIPKSLKGLPITLISAALVALSFLGFGGIVDGLR
ncbi:MAG: electron transport complex protein RnfA, partial [Clostridia bacterium]|nr:electron transport complex protein RnfA [Clostridia bacterium]